MPQPTSHKATLHCFYKYKFLKFALEQATKAQRVIKGIALLFL
jgi:hypothetical protein